MMSRTAAVLLAALAWTTTVAAEDAEGCKDHPLFTRFKGYALVECRAEDFGEAQFPVGPAQAQDDGFPARPLRIAGRKTTLLYGPAEGVTPASPLQVMRNYQNAVKAAGGRVEGDYAHDEVDLSALGGGDRATTLSLQKGREVWAMVRAATDFPYELTIVEREAMQQQIVAQELLDKLQQDGFVALYINFDTAKASIRPDSAALVDEVATMLRNAPNLRVEVGGHTDNVGSADANQTLSEARARSVVAALTQRGIAGARLQARGYGQSAPMADNRSEDGRAKNRRVELKKL